VFRSYSINNLASELNAPDRMHAGHESHATVSPPLETALKQEAQLQIWEAARATSAAPTYFKPVKSEQVCFTDGGLLSNNPIVDVFQEAASFRDLGDTAFGCIVSIGTGVSQTSKPWHNGILATQRALVASLATSDATVDSQMKHLLQDSELDRYWRFEPQGIRLRLATLKFLDDTVAKQRLSKVARVLVRRRKERADTPAWESFAIQVSYVCSKIPCSLTYANRQALLRHWTWDHDYEFPDAPRLAEVEEELDLCRVYG
jgi:hypothetical protein